MSSQCDELAQQRRVRVGMAQGDNRRRFIALVVVLALHCLFLLLILFQPIIDIVADRGRSSVLFFVETPRPAVTPPPLQSAPTQATPTIVVAPNAPEAQPSIAPPSPSPTPAAPIDWTAEAAQAAAAVVDKAIREETRKCDPSDSPSSFLPPCHPRTRQFEWNPEESRVGFSGGLPYIRVGKRCAVGLGFLGCAIGRLPPANGELFEGMEDAERDRSSVPSPNP